MLRETDTAHPQQLSWILLWSKELQPEHFKESRGEETAPRQHTVRQELIQLNVATKTACKIQGFNCTHFANQALLIKLFCCDSPLAQS